MSNRYNNNLPAKIHRCNRPRLRALSGSSGRSIATGIKVRRRPHQNWSTTFSNTAMCHALLTFPACARCSAVLVTTKTKLDRLRARPAPLGGIQRREGKDLVFFAQLASTQTLMVNNSVQHARGIVTNQEIRPWPASYAPVVFTLFPTIQTDRQSATTLKTARQENFGPATCSFCARNVISSADPEQKC